MSTKNNDLGGHAKNTIVLFGSAKCLRSPALHLFPAKIRLTNIDPRVTFHVTCRCHLATFADSSIVTRDSNLLPSQTPSPDVVLKDVRHQPGKRP